MSVSLPAEGLPNKVDGTLETLVVPPYLEHVVFDVIRSTPAVRVEIYPPGARHPLRGGDALTERVGLGGASSTLFVHRPVPGAWLVRKSRAGARVRIRSQQFFPRGLLVRPSLTDAPRQHDRVRVAYAVVDPSGRPIAELPGYRLMLDLTFVKPDGSAEVMPMERRPELDGMAFAAPRESECALAGRYWTTVGVTSVDAGGSRVEIFRDRWSGFSVSPAKAVDCRVGVVPRRWSSRADVRVECVDGGKRAVDAGAFASGSPERLFHASLTRDGAFCESLLDLRYLGGGTWRGVLRGAGRAGDYRLRLDADRALLRPSYNVRLVPASVSFRRDATLGAVWLAMAAIAALVAAIATPQIRRHRVLLYKSNFP